MTKTTKQIRNEKELEDTLKTLSKNHGGAWVFSVKPFSHTVTFTKFQSPSHTSTGRGERDIS